MVSVGFTPPGGSRIELMSVDGAGRGRKVLEVLGTGVPAIKHQTVATPNRDGATWVRALADQRFVLVAMALVASSWSDLWSRQQTLIAGINPKDGLGVLDVTPVEGGTTYETDAILDGGLGFDTPPPGTLTRKMTPSFRCPDPAWRVRPVNSAALSINAVGLSIPMDIPLEVTAATASDILTNSGQLESYPVLTLTGAFTSPRITNETTGQMVWFAALDVAEGEDLVIDMVRRTATLDGVNVMPYRSADSQAWALAKGDNTVTIEIESGTVEMTVEWFTRLIGI